ncbi:ATP synthase subunit s, mitochondrial-like [Lucilia sericata]|uniref:ATP synthase subunit s, mitochondrial-like n=1 Tax=Lucilia sericata TaxID=13632 RepID=UPI0018A80EE4|nr:ATP synthase subunit s, mitochondrial-like [Lucilia sericata]
MTILHQINHFGSKILQNFTTNGLKLSATRKSLWGYVAIAFNRVDTDRLLQVGPDRLCAEWLIKNGGAIRTVELPSRPHQSYNALPPENNRFKIKVVDATGSSIMKIGLEHFKGCNHIDTVILHECKHLESDGLQGLLHLKETLKVLQVSACDNISDEGLMVIGELTNLELLKIFEMRYVKDLKKVEQDLKAKLPNCIMEIK